MHENIRLKARISELDSRNKQLISANYYLKRKNAVLTEKVRDLQKRVKDLQSKFDLSDNLVEDLKNCVSDVPLHLLEGTAKRVHMKRDKCFHPSIKRFALTLHLCSSKAYRYVRREFENALPSERIIRHWCQSVDGDPGINKQSLSYLKKKVKEEKDPVLVTLMLDEISLHQNVQFDGETFYGGTGKYHVYL